MIQITDKHNCCGCEACVQACPKRCISMKRDAEGFLYPVAEAAFCVECGLCEKVCPVLSQYERLEPIQVLAAINKDEAVREKSSSGGVFTLLAEETIAKGGVVFGAHFDDDWQVVMDAAETMEQIASFRGSKYVQARVGDSYARCKQYLDAGREVLFTGTPCQIAGLHHFLRKPYENILAVEIICHGVPSPTVWKKYLGEVVSAQRAKDSLKRQECTIRYDEECNKITLTFPRNKNVFMRAYLSDLISRPSCSACPAKDGKSHADLTLADFWGIERVVPSMYDDRGTSMVLVHTAKGMKAIPFDKVQYEECDQSVLKYNASYLKSSVAHLKRSAFFEAFDTTTDLQLLVEEALRPTFKQKMEQLKHPLGLAKNMIYTTLKPVLKPVSNPSGGGYFSTKEYCSKLSLSNSPRITGISFRDKRAGWKSYSLSIEIQLDG